MVKHYFCLHVTNNCAMIRPSIAPTAKRYLFSLYKNKNDIAFHLSRNLYLEVHYDALRQRKKR
jgi:hypothetical protein